MVALSTPTAHAWMSGWNNEQSVYIGNSTDGTLTNYQMTFNIWRGTGTSSGTTIFLNNVEASGTSTGGGYFGTINTNGLYDLRFTDGSDNTYSYYI